MSQFPKSNTPKVKLFLNPERNKPDVIKPYVPQYVVQGVDPIEYPRSTISNAPPIPRMRSQQPQPRDLPRGSRPPMRPLQPSSPLMDDLTENDADPNQQMIDNNEFVSAMALGYGNGGLEASQIAPNPYQGKVSISNDLPPEIEAQLNEHLQEVASVAGDLAEGGYLLIVQGTPLCSGPQEEIQELARALVFGEHELCEGQPIPTEDLVILKRVAIKVGVFVE